MKTAFFASDPNLGRILAAVGYAGIADLDQSTIDLFLDDVHVVHRGGRRPEYREEDGARVMKQSEITVRVDLHRGRGARHRVDLRPQLRLREDQRRLPQLIRARGQRRAQQPAGRGRRQQVLERVAADEAELLEHRRGRPARRPWRSA